MDVYGDVVVAVVVFVAVDVGVAVGGVDPAVAVVVVRRCPRLAIACALLPASGVDGHQLA